MDNPKELLWPKALLLIPRSRDREVPERALAGVFQDRMTDGVAAEVAGYILLQ
jgi:hypothetical protein